MERERQTVIGSSTDTGKKRSRVVQCVRHKHHVGGQVREDWMEVGFPERYASRVGVSECRRRAGSGTAVKCRNVIGRQVPQRCRQTSATILVGAGRVPELLCLMTSATLFR